MTPLAARLRPRTIDQVIGQSHLVSSGKPIRQAIESQQLFSMLFWGPPGVGKTTLARVIAQEMDREFIELSAVSAGKSDLKKIVEDTRKQKSLLESYQAPIVFIDEIHRFNKAQQDYLLPFVEDGTIYLIGATTENPSFEVISALLSRCRVFTLNPLESKEIELVIERALQLLKEEQKYDISLSTKAKNWLTHYAHGDARKVITLIDQSLMLYNDLSIDNLKNALQSTHINYDKKGEEHYNTISAFIKSMRAGNVDAALYYLARMVHAGEDPKFIARRMVVFASEDVGLAQPTALVVANAVFEAVQSIGYPEAQINLAHGTAYLCLAKKNRSAYDAYFAALRDVESHGHLPIPLQLRNAPTKLMKNLGYGKGYEMYPDQADSLLPEELKNRTYFSQKK